MRLVGKLKQAARARARRIAQAESGVWDAPAGRFYHGGRAGMAVGSLVLPRTQLGDRYLATKQLAAVGADYLEHHASAVFVTDCAALALAFAGRRPHPALYEVMPTPPLEPDEDCEGIGVRSWACQRATVVREVRIPFKVRQGLNIRLRRRISGAGYDSREVWGWLESVLD